MSNLFLLLKVLKESNVIIINYYREGMGKMRFLKLVALTSFAVILLNIVPVEAMMGGGSSSNSDGGMMGGGLCKSFVDVKDLSRNKILRINGISVSYMKQFNKCAGQKFSHYVNKGTNLFFRRAYGEMVGYSPIPESGYREYTSSANWSWGIFYERTGSGVNFKNWAVRANTTYCGTGLSSYKPGYLLASCPSEYLDTTHTYQNFTVQNGFLQGTGTKGENRYVGYSGAADGEVIDSTYFPMDYAIATDVGSYPYDDFIHNKTYWDQGENVNSGVYSIKIDAIRQLLKQEPSMKAKNADPHWWAKRLSLRNDPRTEGAAFRATREDGSYYQSIILLAEPEMRMNVGVTEMLLKDPETGKVVASMKRKVGEAKATVNANAAQLEPETKYLLDVTVTNGSDKKLSSGSQYLIYNDEAISKFGGLGAGQSTTFKDLTYTTPANVNTIEVIAEIDADKYGSDNQFFDDDIGMIKMPVLNQKKGGDLYICGIELLNSAKKQTSAVVIGQKQYIRYRVCYKGDNLGDTSYQIPIKVKTTTAEVTSTGMVQRNEETKTTTVTTTLNSVHKEVAVIDVPFQSKVPDVTGEIEIDPNGKLPEKANKDKENDTDSKTFGSSYNVTITDLQVMSPKIQNNQTGGKVTLKYKLTLTAPKEDSTSKTVQTQIKVGSTTTVVKETLTPGQTVEVTQTVNAPSSANGYEDGLPIEVFTNYKYQDLFESTYADNKATTYWHKTFDLSGVCGVSIDKNNSNKWEHEYKYFKDIIETDKPTITGTRPEKISVWQDESYQIKAIRVRSKLMKDLGWGDDGWIDIMTYGKDPVIKAGYGFEMEIDVEYKTNAFNNIYQQKEKFDIGEIGPNKWEVGRVDGNSKHKPESLQTGTTDIFLKTQDDKVLSLLGTKDSIKGFELVKKEDKLTTDGTMTWTYKIRAHESPNSNVSEQVDRIYIDENTKDGKVAFTVYTPSISGLEGVPNKKLLCDAKTFNFIVKGSYLDDFNTHIVE